MSNKTHSNRRTFQIHRIKMILLFLFREYAGDNAIPIQDRGAISLKIMAMLNAKEMKIVLLVKKVVASKEWQALPIMFAKRNLSGAQITHAGLIQVVLHQIKYVNSLFILFLYLFMLCYVK